MSRASVSSRRSAAQSSPERRFLASILNDERNTELNHRDALAAAQAEHERVRAAAIRVFNLNALEEERRNIVLEQQREQERLRKEQEVAAEEARLRALKAQQVPRPPPEPEPAPQKKSLQPPASQQAQAATTSPALSKASVTTPSQPPAQTTIKAATQPLSNGIFGASTQASRSPLGQPAATQEAKPAAPQPQPNGLTQPTPSLALPPKPAAAAQPAAAPPVSAGPDRYLLIHQELKKLRKQLEEMAKAPGSPLKAKMGDMRREIRKSMGQLTGGKGANVMPVKKIKAALRDSLNGSLPSPLVDASAFVADKRDPVPDAQYNEPQLPALFIYLMSIFSKSIVNQFINECGASPKAADPIGVVAAQIFSDRDFQWRGQSMVDILLAKLRRSCPVLFGVRGSDKTVAGRAVIGWRRDGGSWMPESMHYDRMSGLGAGFAAVALRDFSKANKANPYPPTNYWRALATMVNTPQAEVSDTQYIVLKAMIDGHEPRFIQFYGNAAIAALKVALVEFPKKAPGSVAAGALRVLGEVLKNEKGLDLD